MNRHPKILRFIASIRNSFPESVKTYTQGCCFGFHLILKEVFPDATAYYNSDHVITKVDDKFYDITGEVTGEGYLPMIGHYTTYYNRLTRRHEQASGLY